jgi:uncharacterized protein with PIN domain
MAVPCPTCGRTYDIALFQFGRTLHCTCGTRVGLEPRDASASGEPQLFADAMLGGLTRWLRILGYDTAYQRHIEDEALVRRCLVEGRILLTRDRRLLEEWRIKRALLISAEKPLEQLREVVTRLGLNWSAGLFLRCTLCNTPVRAADRASVRGQVPERIWQEQERFARCPQCDRVYWEGSHTRRIRARLESAIPEYGILGEGARTRGG